MQNKWLSYTISVQQTIKWSDFKPISTYLVIKQPKAWDEWTMVSQILNTALVKESGGVEISLSKLMIIINFV